MSNRLAIKPKPPAPCTPLHAAVQDQRVLQLQLSEEEKEAAELMLRCAYSGGAAAETATAQQLLGCMILADRYQLRQVMDCCQAQIMALDSAAIAWSEAVALLHLPPGLKEAEGFRALTTVCVGVTALGD